MIRTGCLIGLCALGIGPAFGQSNQEVKVQIASYGDLANLIGQQKGKVVVVDFWGTFCPPCVKELPHLVQIHNKYAASGLVTITVSLDPIKTNPKIIAKVREILEKADARVVNVILDEEFTEVQKKLRFEGPPCVFVFDRKGKWMEFKEEQFRHDLIEQAVVQFLMGN